MSFALSDKTLAQTQTDMFGRLIGSTPLKDFTPGSTIYGLVRTSAEEYQSIRNDLNVAFAATFLQTASGMYLDAKAAGFGLRRNVSFITNVPCTSQAVAIRTKNGQPILQSLADKTGSYRVIGVGYDVKSSDGSIVLSTSESCYFLAADAIVYLSVSGQLGDNQQLSPGTLTSFAWTDCPLFAGADIDNLEVVQPLTIVGIQQIESEEAFRNRVKSLPTYMATANTAAVNNAVIANPEVAYVSIVRNIRGTGSANIVAVPVSRRISFASLKSMQSAVDAVKSYGEDIKVMEPAYVPVTMELSVPSDAVGRKAEQAIKLAFTQLGLGATISDSIIVKMATDAGVLGVKIKELIVDGNAIIPGKVVYMAPEELLELDIPITLTARYTNPIKVTVE